ncbi:MAG: hypothetical protein WC541_09320 [Dehalococcoidia bacterium]
MDIFTLLWLIAVILAGLAAGQMLGELLLIGRFQSWFFETGNADMFSKSYVLFRKTKRPNRLFHAVYVAAILVDTIYAAALLLAGRPGLLPVIAAALQWLFLVVFYASGFAGIEKKLFAGSDSKQLGDRFLRMNIPSLCIYSLLLCAAFCILVIMRIQF